MTTHPALTPSAHNDHTAHHTDKMCSRHPLSFHHCPHTSSRTHTATHTRTHTHTHRAADPAGLISYNCDAFLHHSLTLPTRPPPHSYHSDVSDGNGPSDSNSASK